MSILSFATPRHLQIFLVSLAGLLMEIGYTRVVGFKLFYYFTFMVIGFTMLGLGAGAVFLATSPRLRRVPLPSFLAWSCSVGSIVAVLCYFAVAGIETNTFSMFQLSRNLLPLIAVCGGLFASFLVFGLIISRILGEHPEQSGSLYFADLVGAALACGLAVPLMWAVTPPGLIMVAAAVLAGAGAVTGGATVRVPRTLAAVLATCFALLACQADRFALPVPDVLKTMNPSRMGGIERLFGQWSPVFRIDVLDMPWQDENVRVIAHDGLIGSTLHRFDGDRTTLDRFETDPRAFPFRLLRPHPQVLIIGAAGGHEILSSIYFQAEHVTAVELNPVTVSLLTDHFADYSGHLPERPDVTLVNAEGRSYLGRQERDFDLIHYVAPDSYTAQNAAASGAFVLSESYLYTAEAIAESMAHLTEGGLLCMQFGEFFYDTKPNRTTRYLASARDALASMGIDDFQSHVLVATTPSFLSLSTILVSREPLDADDVARFRDAVAKVEGGVVRYAPGMQAGEDPVSRVILAGDDAELDAWFSGYSYAVDAVHDDSPFFWHFVRFQDAFRFRGSGNLDLEDAIGERVLLTMLAITVGFAALFLLSPFVAIRADWVALPYKGLTFAYFSAIGLGFMFFEIVLIQRLTLLLGYPTYSLIVTLFSLLAFSGLGSFATGAYAGRRDVATGVLLSVLLAFAVFCQYALPSVVVATVGLELWVRIVIAIAVLAPAGLCLGAFMPLGLMTVGSMDVDRDLYVAWAWAVNGFASVTGSVLTTILSMSFGFTFVLWLGAAVYIVAVATLRRMPAVRA